MSCHGVAVVGGNQPYPPNYNKPIAFFTDPAYFTSPDHPRRLLVGGGDVRRGGLKPLSSRKPRGAVRDPETGLMRCG